MPATLILGGGLAGLSAAYHLGHATCCILERENHPFGHIAAQMQNGFTWDQGPHVSFTKHPYVRELFGAAVGGAFEEFTASISNIYHGHWIGHPAQLHLHALPEPLRSRCLDSFLAARSDLQAAARGPTNYQEWLVAAFGEVFANELAAAYTRKYWTCEPAQLGISWIGERILHPSVEDVIAGASAPLSRAQHYITTVRYPTRGGFQAFASTLAKGAQLRVRAAVQAIDLRAHEVRIQSGQVYRYQRLVSTLPLPTFLDLVGPLPDVVGQARRALRCTELLLVNLEVRGTAGRGETWFYVYDEDKLSCRINFTEHFSPHNSPSGRSGIQVEVYASAYRRFTASHDEIARRVVNEVVNFGLCARDDVVAVHHRHVPWANIIFDHEAPKALAVIWNWLEQFGLQRESDDTHPLCKWDAPPATRPSGTSLAFAGRYAQWKYFWSDDCVLRGRALAEMREACQHARPRSKRGA